MSDGDGNDTRGGRGEDLTGREGGRRLAHRDLYSYIIKPRRASSKCIECMNLYTVWGRLALISWTLINYDRYLLQLSIYIYGKMRVGQLY